MEIADWPFQGAFEKLYLRARKCGVDHKDVMTEELPLIWWEGSTEAVSSLGDPQKEPPAEIFNPGQVHPLEEFLCWLMLPKDYSGANWYFGRVYSKRKSLPDELRMFQDIAAEAGSYLRRDNLFRDYLAPCLKHIELVDRFPQFQTNLDVSYWCALLFARPEFKNPINFPYKNTKIGQEILANKPIDNPFKSTAEVIVRWQLNWSKPMPATGRVAPPYQWPSPATMPSLAQADERLPEPHFVSVVGHYPVEGLSENQVTVTSSNDFAQLPVHGGVIVEPQIDMQAAGGESFEKMQSESQAGASSNDEAGNNHPQATAEFLDLIVDREHRTVRRQGCDPCIDLSTQNGVWHIFVKMFDAGESGTTGGGILNGYPAEASSVKHVRTRLNDELIPLSIATEQREWRLVCTKTRSQK